MAESHVASAHKNNRPIFFPLMKVNLSLKVKPESCKGNDEGDSQIRNSAL